jgi:transcriptional regulator with XRE-family HTH domain
MAPKLATTKKVIIDNLETGRRVRKERNSKGTSLRKLANLMGIQPAFLSDLELGRRNWTQDRFDLAMRILNGDV